MKIAKLKQHLDGILNLVDISNHEHHNKQDASDLRLDDCDYDRIFENKPSYGEK